VGKEPGGVRFADFPFYAPLEAYFDRKWYLSAILRKARLMLACDTG
jgi:hypothetical protein